jgi:hypothetical protein
MSNEGKWSSLTFWRIRSVYVQCVTKPSSPRIFISDYAPNVKRLSDIERVSVR